MSIIDQLDRAKVVPFAAKNRKSPRIGEPLEIAKINIHFILFQSIHTENHTFFQETYSP